jgi:hypothetical protein
MRLFRVRRPIASARGREDRPKWIGYRNALPCSTRDIVPAKASGP